ncbi:MAG: hypothetical protein O7F71_08455 [Gammaproteobacteria bacterium]|nr:hypothetical protein [Gammaproteobacteria bacterium]
MQAFDLKWPKTTVTLFSDGKRCRIVWRTDQGMGGAVNNNDQCKRRIADSLTGAPKLLEELRSAGFAELASEVETLAEQNQAESSTPAESTSPRKETGDAADGKTSKKLSEKMSAKKSAKKSKKPAEKQVIEQWLRDLEGTDTWADTDAQRSLKWHKLLAASSGAVDAHEFHLKTPARKNPGNWVVRRSWPNAKRGEAKPEFFAAEDFKGVCVCLLSFFKKAKAQVLDDAFAGCAKLVKDFDEVKVVADSWAAARGVLQDGD